MSTTSRSRAGPEVLRPWIEVARPAPEIADGTFLQGEFAANLQQVKDGTGPSVYGNALEFFRRTHITAGMRSLLAAAVRRLSGNGGNPIIQTKTGFGGGKTHSLIALYHLATSCDQLLGGGGVGGSGRVSGELAAILKDAGLHASQGLTAKVAVLHGGWLSPNSTRATPAGDPLNTLWGEMAWQLAGQAGYDTLGEAARSGVAPGGEDLDRLLKLAGPSVILVDEIVNYARNDDLDRISTFLHNLTEALTHQAAAAMVVSLPMSDSEAGGERGVRTLAVLENILSRTQSVLEVGQASEDDGYAVVKRRLFEDEFDLDACEATCQWYSRMYQRYPDYFPEHARAPGYLEKMRRCYPVHPGVFDRLFQDWSAYHEFQRTRGVLRLVARSVSLSCAASDPSPMLMAADVQLSDSHVGEEFMRLLGPEWGPAMSEADSEHSRVRAIDRGRPARFGAAGGAAGRISRAVMLGSSPRAVPRGLDSRQVNLDVSIPGQGLAVYTEALEEMGERLHHLYRAADGRYFFDDRANLNREAGERSGGFSDDELDAEIVRRLEPFRRAQSAPGVVVAPMAPQDVPDIDRTRLVILPPNRQLPARQSERDFATETVRSILSSTGRGAGRVWPNSLLFLAARSDGIRELRATVGLFLAWDGMRNEPALLRDPSRLQEVVARRTASSEAAQRALLNAYRWVLAPRQADPLRAHEYDLDGWMQVPSNPSLVQGAVEHFAGADQLVVANIRPEHLLQAAGSYLWGERSGQQHIRVSDLWSALNRHVYMGLRFVSKDVFFHCLQLGIQQGVFAYSDDYDSESLTYSALYWPNAKSKPPTIADDGLLVSPVAAEEFLRRHPEKAAGFAPRQTEGFMQHVPGNGTALPPEGRPTRIVARKTIETGATAYDLNLLRDEIALNLAQDGGEVTIEVTITGVKADGFSPTAASSVAENGEALGAELNDLSLPAE